MATALTFSDWEQHQPVRLATVLPIAAVLTVFLFLLMRGMVAMDFSLGLRTASPVMVINPVIPERPVSRKRDMPKPVDDVTPPPPPPRIATQSAQQPSDAIATGPVVLPDLGAQTLLNTNTMVFADRGAQPIIHAAPLYPARAATQNIEGACTGSFDVSGKGIPYNIKAICSSPVFVRATVRAIEKWRYTPKIEDGVAVPRRGLRVPFRFTMGDH